MTKMNKKEGRRRKLSKETEKDTELEKEENTSAESEEVKEAADTAENATEDTEKKAEESETEKLKKELAEANDKYLRLMAEYDNFRKRSAKERLELTDTAKGNVINGFLPVFDNFERALGTETQDNAVHNQAALPIEHFSKALLISLYQLRVFSADARFITPYSPQYIGTFLSSATLTASANLPIK